MVPAVSPDVQASLELQVFLPSSGALCGSVSPASLPSLVRIFALAEVPRPAVLCGALW